ncbi:MAG: dihydrofolate reductase family protein [Ignavibacteriae bacterium]|nr:dihydrofolate reductase family protein [Ignavibacteriota bacterium]
MRKIIFAINTTIDGYADHTAGIVDAKLHDFFTNLLSNSDVILFGRKTYELMENFWPNAKDYPQSDKSTIDFSDKINSIKKIVFSKTLEKVDWENSELCKNNLADTIHSLKKQKGKNISIGSLSLASQLTKLELIDEYWFLVHPIIMGSGKRLFEDHNKRSSLMLIDTKTFKSGVVVAHYVKKVN